MRRLLVLVALLGVLAGGGAWLLLQQTAAQASGKGPAAADIRVTVRPGSSLRGVLQELEGLGALRHARLIEIYLRCCAPQYAGRGITVKAGEYLVGAGESPLSIVAKLEAGRVILEQVTVVEGWTLAQMRAALDAHPKLVHRVRGLPPAQVMTQLGHTGQPPEGRFFPDTYRFAAGTSDLDILRLAYDRLAAELDAAWRARQPDLPVRTADDALVLASIVEKETGVATERKRIAGVFVNRLRINMRLQSDPTVIYGIGARYDGNIRARDLSTDTPYNTYTRTGLPPAPIALPGKDAIWAAVQPEATDAFYFVATGEGAHVFAATYEEHQANVQRYQLKRPPRPNGT